MEQHKHCKLCGKTITESDLTIINVTSDIRDYYRLSICMKCIVKKGIESFEKKNNKPKNLNYGKTE